MTQATPEMIDDMLAETYPDAHCELDFENPLELLVATVLSAQCTDARVNLTTPGLFAKYPDARAYAEAEIAFFDDVVSGVDARRDEIDQAITAKLAEGWSLARLDKAMRAILRAGTYELLARPDVTVGTVIDEYLDIAHAFFGEKDVKFVNGLLDKVAGDVRG